MEALRPEKKHRKAKSGVKAAKKDANSKKKRGLTTDRHNPRAFGVANVVRTKRTQQRNLDRSQKKEVVPLTDRSADEHPPPVFVVVMGPTGVGKTTLIRSLVKIYTGQNLADSKGPITVIAGRKRRITLFECPAENICAMTDLAKVADLVLLMVDASYGFEMETFEFLNQLQLHGFPKVIGVLSHLDAFKANKQLQSTKKALKNRFWTEIYKGAKLFDLSGVVHGKYPKNEIKRLSLYVSRVKFRPLVWRNTHPYVVVDRVEDITASRAEGQNRDIALFGYVRGTNLKPGMRVHLIGAGDFDMASVTALEDPCPLEGSGDKQGKKSLKAKDTKLYAPMANVGRVQMDTDGVYIDIKNIHYTKPEYLQLGEQADSFKEFPLAGPGSLLRSLQDARVGVDEQMGRVEMRMFAGSEARKGGERDEYDEEDDEDDDDEEGGDEDDEDDEGEDGEEEEEEDGAGDDDDDEEEEGEDGEGMDAYDALRGGKGGFGGGDDDEEEDEEDEEDEDDEDDEDDDGEEDDEEMGQNYDDDDEEEDEEDEDERAAPTSSSFAWKDNMRGKAQASYESRAEGESGKDDLMQQVYGFNWAVPGGLLDQVNGSKVGGGGPGKGSGSARAAASTADDDDESDDELFTSKRPAAADVQYLEDNRADSSRAAALALSSTLPPGDWKDGRQGADVFSRLKARFVTSQEGWKKSKAGGGQKSAGSAGGDDEDDEDGDVYGDFEDLETGQVYGGGGRAGGNDDEEEEDEDGEESVTSEQMEEDNEKIDAQLRDENAKRKAQKKTRFDDEYDTSKRGEEDEEEAQEDGEYAAAQRRAQEELRARNKEEFGEHGEAARLQLEGFRQGIYAKIVLRGVPPEFASSFRPQYPVVIGGLLPHESALGYVRCRVKRHRWHRRVLKSNDPLIFSVGWRRFQSLPVFATEDQNERLRHLKYTPEHMHCVCTFYGPLVPPNTGILAFQTTSRGSANFRISLTGTALELQASSQVVKKLKLVGHPSKVFKHTAFIEGMFNSSLEVSKFIGAKLKTVSGIRGSIKRALKDGKPGSFRAAFEDKPLLSDIVICRLWVPVDIKKLYNPVHTLLDPDWQGVRTVAQIRRDERIPQETNKDSLYKPVVREKRVFATLNVPKKLQEALPFASKPKQQDTLNRKSYMARRAVTMEPEERKERAAVQILQTIGKDKRVKRHEANTRRKEKSDQKAAKVKEFFADEHAYEKKRKYAAKGKEELRKRQKSN